VHPEGELVTTVRTSRASWIGRRILVLIATLAGVAIVAAVNTPSAVASCDPENEIFWGDWIEVQPSGSHWRTNAYGSRNDILLKDRDMGNQCYGGATDAENVGSTSFLDVNGSVTYVEVGWQETQTFPSTNNWYWFTEWFINGVLRARHLGSYPCPLALNQYDQWQVGNIPGTTKFKLWVDCLNGTDPKLLDTSDAMVLDDQGIPKGETWRKGGTSVGMQDSHRNVAFKNGSGNWVDWADPDCEKDDASDWGSDPVGAVGWDTIQNNSHTCDHVG
jgi:hypothetical protein